MTATTGRQTHVHLSRPGPSALAGAQPASRDRALGQEGGVADETHFHSSSKHPLGTLHQAAQPELNRVGTTCVSVGVLDPPSLAYKPLDDEPVVSLVGHSPRQPVARYPLSP